MKKILSVILVLLLVISLRGCSLWSQEQTGSVSFYYQRIDYSYREEDSVIAPEVRELSGYRDNLRYLMTLYFHGPQNPDLLSPFPSGTAVVDIRTEEDTLVVVLSAALTQLKDMDLTVACTCLAKTCFELVDAQQLRIETPDVGDESHISILFTRDSFVLTDTIPAETAGDSD